DDPHELRWKARKLADRKRALGSRRGLMMRDCRSGGQAPDRHLVDDDAETPDVRAGIDGEALALLGRHVPRSADYGTFWWRRFRGSARRVGACPRSDAEVGDLPPTAFAQH